MLFEHNILTEFYYVGKNVSKTTTAKLQSKFLGIENSWTSVWVRVEPSNFKHNYYLQIPESDVLYSPSSTYGVNLLLQLWKS